MLVENITNIVLFSFLFFKIYSFRWAPHTAENLCLHPISFTVLNSAELRPAPRIDTQHPPGSRRGAAPCQDVSVAHSRPPLRRVQGDACSRVQSQLGAHLSSRRRRKPASGFPTCPTAPKTISCMKPEPRASGSGAHLGSFYPLEKPGPLHRGFLGVGRYCLVRTLWMGFSPQGQNAFLDLQEVGM